MDYLFQLLTFHICFIVALKWDSADLKSRIIPIKRQKEQQLEIGRIQWKGLCASLLKQESGNKSSRKYA